MRSKRRLLKVFERIESEPLRALVATLVQARVEHEGDRAPLAQLRSVVDGYARKYDSSPEWSVSPPEPLQESERDDVQGMESRDDVVTLKSLVLKNFGSYYGEHVVELAPNGKKRNVSVVVGSNGDGKSTLFYALNWALYGEEYLSELQRDKGKLLSELINRKAVLEAEQERRMVEAMVLLHFSTNGHDYYVARDVVAVPRRSGETVETGIDRIDVRLRRVDSNGNHAEIFPSSLGSLLSRLPSHVKEFYLFDGERINRFVSPGSQALIRAAIRQVMGIQDLELAADDLAKVVAQFRAEAKKESKGELSKVSEEIESKTNELANIRQRLLSIQADEVTLNSRVSEIDALLEQTPDTRPLKERRARLEKDAREAADDEARLLYEVRDLAAGASSVFAANAVQAMMHELESRRSAGEIPGPINRQLLRDLLDTHACICGTDLSEGTERRAMLQAKLAEIDQRAEQSETLIQLWSEMSAVSRFAMQDGNSLDRRYIDLTKFQKRRSNIKAELDEVSRHLLTLDDVDRSGWERERRQKQDQVINAKAEKLDLERREDRLVNEIRTLKAKEADLTRSQSRAQALILRANWAEAAHEAVRFVFREYAAIARRDVEASTARLWKIMLSNVTPYSVQVGEDFELTVKNQAGQSAIQDLAMGQQQCLGLAFITAVAQVAESRPPLIIDMPFGRLGADVAASVAATLPGLANQLILFVLPETEWNTYTRQAIEPYLARVYCIRYDADALATRFVPCQGDA